MPEELLRLAGVSKSYQASGPPVLDGVDLTIRAGQTLGLSGPSGGGKSTLARIALGLERAQAGTVFFRGRDLRAMGRAERREFHRQVQVVWQDPYLYLPPQFNVARLVAEPLAVHGLAPRSQRSERVKELLALVGLEPGLAHSKPHQLSGGQCQRVALARALACRPALLILDEALAGLDTISQAGLVKLLGGICRERELALLFIAHDPKLIRLMCQRQAELQGGRLRERPVP
ncbi:MAG: dipeptide/oligopeptide/nickel ABC transporter ATP-binding protein [Proteobacteria bacterium]|nr:dipeptide/oligopeptide/nickel ABC transporter ATP-binding protein [Pseudomonadota bacterium]MBU4385088.1 dipeptide/oligopeptide/nickel ABC transporter ATP-binding protein [Pseudomonadota bacterium]MBU4603711.1 dipeptide/oligopeptide/nickel ABC transporter ATP-binding protein [Pseudomonadota bacterium]MCG2763210.1 dipeptide/oligopeptide/nickel ABC transporter ATP-binding protein [Desulfarculaceae bacterium]